MDISGGAGGAEPGDSPMNIGGNGGSSILGSGGPGRVGFGAGISGAGYGGGGGGGAGPPTPATSGGAGTKGIVIVEEFY